MSLPQLRRLHCVHVASRCCSFNCRRDERPPRQRASQQYDRGDRSLSARRGPCVRRRIANTVGRTRIDRLVVSRRRRRPHIWFSHQSSVAVLLQRRWRSACCAPTRVSTGVYVRISLGCLHLQFKMCKYWRYGELELVPSWMLWGNASINGRQHVV